MACDSIRRRYAYHSAVALTAVLSVCLPPRATIDVMKAPCACHASSPGTSSGRLAVASLLACEAAASLAVGCEAAFRRRHLALREHAHIETFRGCRNATTPCIPTWPVSCTGLACPHCFYKVKSPFWGRQLLDPPYNTYTIIQQYDTGITGNDTL